MSDDTPGIHPAELPALVPPASSGLAALLDYAGQVIQFSAVAAVVATLAGSLCLALVLAGQEFTRAARSSRHAARTSRSVRTMSETLQSNERRASRLREQMKRDIDAARRTLLPQD